MLDIKNGSVTIPLSEFQKLQSKLTIKAQEIIHIKKNLSDFGEGDADMATDIYYLQGFDEGKKSADKKIKELLDQSNKLFSQLCLIHNETKRQSFLFDEKYIIAKIKDILRETFK